MPSWKKVVVDGTSPSFNQISTTDITASGNISASGGTISAGDYKVDGLNALNGLSGNVQIGHADHKKLSLLPKGVTTNHITASGNISASGTIEANGDFIVNSIGRVGINTTSPDYKLDVAGNVGINQYIYHNGDDDTYLRLQTDQLDLSAGGNVATLNANGFSINHITASANISASSTTATHTFGGQTTVNQITASAFKFTGTGDAELDVDGHITASGNISSSGRLQAFALDVVGGGSSTRQTAVQYHTGTTNIIFGDGDLPTKVQGTNINLTANVTASGNISSSGTLTGAGLNVVGTSNLDAMDIDGNVQLDGTFTVGVNGTGQDVRFNSDTSNEYLLWDQSEGRLKLYDNIKLGFGSGPATSTDDARIEFDGTSFKIKTGTSTTTADIDLIPEGGKGVTISGSGKTHLTVEGDILQKSDATNPFLSASMGNLELSGSGPALLAVDGNISGSSTSTGSFARLELVGGAIDLKNDGNQSYVKFYCEDANQHFAKLQAPAHADFAGNTIVTLPATTTTLVGINTTDTLTNKTLTSPDIDTPDIDGGTIDGTPIGNSTAAEGNFTAVTASVSISGSLASTGSFGYLRVAGNNYLGDPNTLPQIAEADADSGANQDKIILWDESADLWKYMTLDDLQDEIDTAGDAGGGISFVGSTANGVATFNASDEATVESNLTFDGSTLIATGDLSASGDFQIQGTGSLQYRLFDTGSNPAGQTYSADGQAQGDIVKFGSVNTGTMVAGKMYYLNTEGQWVLTNAGDNTAGADELLAIALGDTPATDGMLLKGIVAVTSNVANVGRALYMSGTDGAITGTQPNSTNNIVRIVGYTIDATKDTIYFNPDSTWIKHT